jgi:hypothetical protein
MALDLTVGRRGSGTRRVIERCVQHAVCRRSWAIAGVRDVPLTWYVGLDAEGTRIGDALWHAEDLGNHDAGGRAIPTDLRQFGSAAAPIEGDAVYLILAMTTDKVLRMKPQNLLTGLPARFPVSLT